MNWHELRTAYQFLVKLSHFSPYRKIKRRQGEARLYRCYTSKLSAEAQWKGMDAHNGSVLGFAPNTLTVRDGVTGEFTAC